MAAVFPKALNLKEKIELFLYRDGAMTLARVLVGGVLGAVIGSGASIGVIALVGAGLVGLTALAHTGIVHAKKRVLTDLYREEIAAKLGKTPEGVTPKDLDALMVTPEEGGKGSHAIKAAVTDYGRIRNFHIGVQIITAAVMTTGLAALESLFPGIPTLALAGTSSLLYNELFETVRAAGEILTDVNKGTITRDIRAINDQIGLGGRVSSTRVFGAFVKANSKLAETILKDYGDEYEALNITVKRQLVQKYDRKYHIYKITQDINYGHINPTELAFLAYGQRSGVPRRVQALTPFKGLEGEGRELCREENGQTVCRGGSDAAIMEDNAYEVPSLHTRLVQHNDSPFEGPEADTGATYDPRELFRVERLRRERQKDPFKTVQ